MMAIKSLNCIALELGLKHLLTKSIQYDWVFRYYFLSKCSILFCQLYKIDVLNKLYSALNTGGYLFLSSSEILPQEIKGFETIRDVGGKCYRKR